MRIGVDFDQETYSVFAREYIKNILKDLEIEISLAYMTKSNPLALLAPMIRMSVDAEIIMADRIAEENAKEMDEEKKKRSFHILNCFQLRKSIIPKYFDFDNETMIQMFATGVKSEYLRGEDMEKNRIELWKSLFKPNSRIFKKKHYVVSRRISIMVLVVQSVSSNKV